MSFVKYNQADNVYINVNIEGRTRNHRCHGRAASINTYSDGVCILRYPACKARASYYVVTCALSDSTVFFHIIS
jgi:hypothetical protein